MRHNSRHLRPVNRVETNDDSPVDRVSILMRGAYNVGKTSLCKAFIEALDEMKMKNDKSSVRPGIEASAYGVYSRRLNMKDIVPFFTNPKHVAEKYFSDSHCVIVNLVDTAGFDTHMSRLPESMIRDVDAVMLLFSCDSKEDSLRCCHVAYDILVRSPQLSSSVFKEYYQEQPKMVIREVESSGRTTTDTTPKFPIFMLVGTKGDLVRVYNNNNNNNSYKETLFDMNKIRDYWGTIKIEEDAYTVNQYKKLNELENKIITQNHFALTRTQFTSAVNGGGVLKTFLTLIANIIETRLTIIQEEEKEGCVLITKSTTMSEQQQQQQQEIEPVLSDLSSELRRVNKKTTTTTTLHRRAMNMQQREGFALHDNNNSYDGRNTDSVIEKIPNKDECC